MATRSTDGIARSSSSPAAGNGRCGVVIRTIGPSRFQNASSATIEATSAPHPQACGFSSTVNSRPVRHRRQDGGHVERHEAAQVDHRGLDALGGEQLGRGHRPRHHQTERHDRAVAALAEHLRRAEAVDDLAVGHSSFDA